MNNTGSRSNIIAVSIQPLASIAIIVSRPLFVFSPQILLKVTVPKAKVFDCMLFDEETK